MKAYKILTLLLLSGTLYSCQKVINVKTDTSATKYVVEGNVTDQPGPYTIKITRSVSYNQDNTFPGVSNAQVMITDVTSGATDTLAEVSAGIYRTHLLAGIPGHTYNLNINSGGTVFTSSSTMPMPIQLDSLYTEKSMFGGDDLHVVPVYTDPVGKGNAFHLILTVGDSVSQQIYIHDDDITDGQQVKIPFFSDIDILAGDSVTVELQCIDHDVAQYYNDLDETKGQNSASPANPRSNVTGGALGYFSAHTVYKQSVIAH